MKTKYIIYIEGRIHLRTFKTLEAALDYLNMPKWDNGPLVKDTWDKITIDKVTSETAMVVK